MECSIVVMDANVGKASGMDPLKGEDNENKKRQDETHKSLFYNRKTTNEWFRKSANNDFIINN